MRSEDGAVRAQNRGGKGRRDIATSNRNGLAITLLRVHDDDDLMLITTGGMIMRIKAKTVRQTGRATQGVRVVNLAKGDTMAAVARIAEE